MISIAILTFNRQEVLLKNLEEIRKQTYPDREVIIVDNGNSEQTRNLVAEHYPQSTHLKRHVIALPIHQDLSLSDMDYISEKVMEYMRND